MSDFNDPDVENNPIYHDVIAARNANRPQFTPLQIQHMEELKRQSDLADAYDDNDPACWDGMA